MNDGAGGTATGTTGMRPARVILLAAGAARRFGGGKLTASWRGAPVLVHGVRTLRDAGVAEIVAVLPPAAADPKLHDLATELSLAVAVNPDPSRGMGSSLAVGAARLLADPDPAAAEGPALLALADMPAIRPATVRALLAACGTPRAIVRPAHAGRRGHPVAFGPAHLAALAALSGDVGARSILAAHPEHLIDLPVDDPGVLYDVDTREDLARGETPRPGIPEGTP